MSFSWNSDASAYSNGRPVKVTVSISGSGTTPNDGSQTVSTGYSEKRTITVTATPSEGKAESWTGSATSHEAPPPPPDPKVILRPGSPVSEPGCDIDCRKFDVEVQDFPAGNHEVQCWSSNGGAHRFNNSTHSISVPASGNKRQMINCWHGGWPSQPGMRVWAKVGGVDSGQIHPW